MCNCSDCNGILPLLMQLARKEVDSYVVFAPVVWDTETGAFSSCRSGQEPRLEHGVRAESLPVSVGDPTCCCNSLNRISVSSVSLTPMVQVFQGSLYLNPKHCAGLAQALLGCFFCFLVICLEVINMPKKTSRLACLVSSVLLIWELRLIN